MIFLTLQELGIYTRTNEKHSTGVVVSQLTDLRIPNIYPVSISDLCGMIDFVESPWSTVMPVVILLLCLLLIHPVWAEQSSPNSSSSPALGPICKIVDGDTYHYCDGTKIRLDSVDTPEKGEPFYWVARRSLADLLQTRDIKLEGCHTDTTGKRQACRVFANGKDVQAELVRQGMAWDWPKYSGGKYQAEEREAMEAKRGLWVDSKATEVHWGTRKRD
ncbi:MAG TPA: thermonuclease family protein [Coleofasciculaceae cyanobacterium]|jgi:endonuclease YncB( thermonuclease family)